MKRFIAILLLALAAVLTFCSCSSMKSAPREFAMGIDGQRYYYEYDFGKWYGMDALRKSEMGVWWLLRDEDSLRQEGEPSVFCEFLAKLKYDVLYDGDYIGAISADVTLTSYYGDFDDTISVTLKHIIPYARYYDIFATKYVLCYAYEHDGEWSVDGLIDLSEGYLQKIRNS